MNKFQAVVEELGRMDQNIPQLSRIRNDNLLCTQVYKIRYVFGRKFQKVDGNGLSDPRQYRPVSITVPTESRDNDEQVRS